MVGSLIFGILAVAIRKKIYKIFNNYNKATLSGQALLFVSSISTTISFFSAFLIFTLFDKAPNWFILTPIFVITWFGFAPALYKSEFESGAAHWGMVYGVITWFVKLYLIN